MRARAVVAVVVDRRCRLLAVLVLTRRTVAIKRLIAQTLGALIICFELRSLKNVKQREICVCNFQFL